MCAVFNIELPLTLCHVVIGDLNGDSAERDAAAIRAEGGGCVGLAYDQSDDRSIEALVGAMVDRLGAIDFVFINAMDMDAVTRDIDLLDIDIAVFDRTLAVGLRGSVVLARAVLPHILHRRGALAFTSSDVTHFGEPTRLPMP